MALNASASKYQLTSTPASPSECIGCKQPAKGSNFFIDTTFSIDYFGAVLICVDCAKEMCQLIGYVDAELVMQASEASNELSEKLAKETQKVEALEDVVRAYGLGQFLNLDSDDSVDTPDKGEKQDNKSITGNESGLFE